MPTSKAERLLNLVIALVNAPRFRSAAWIHQHVAGYADAPTVEAFNRMFERDKQELRELGIPVHTEGSAEDGYRIPQGEFALPPMSFSPAEAAALALAGRLWDTTVLADAGTGALRKIRDAANGARDTAVAGAGAASGEGAGSEAGAGGEAGAGDVAPDTAALLLQPRVRTSDPGFAEIYAAIRARRAVRFDYRKDPAAPPERRTVQPWGLVSYRGRWYVVGHDQDRGAARTFRLSRITGVVKPFGRAGAVIAPAGIDLLAHVAGSADESGEHVPRFAVLRIRPGSAAGLRRGGTVLVTAARDGEFDQVQVPLDSLWDTARRIAAHGPDIVVIDPVDLVDAVRQLLTGAARAAA